MEPFFSSDLQLLCSAFPGFLSWCQIPTHILLHGFNPMSQTLAGSPSLGFLHGSPAFKCQHGAIHPMAAIRQEDREVQNLRYKEGPHTHIPWFSSPHSLKRIRMETWKFPLYVKNRFPLPTSVIPLRSHSLREALSGSSLAGKMLQN